MKTKRSRKSKKNGGHVKTSNPVRTLVAHIPDDLFRRIKVASAKADKPVTRWVEGVCRQALGR